MKCSDLHRSGETAIWFKSSYSTGSANCVEVADLGQERAIRDTKHRDLGSLFFGADEWQAFIDSTKEV